MRLPNKFQFSVLVAATTSGFVLSACGGGDKLPPAPGVVEVRPMGQMVPDTPVMIGQPYDVQGVQYAPADTANYDSVGYAGWYGEDRREQPTANGEAYQESWVSAAHKTLPLPSYVEVTSLDTGRTILVRVNDRGPMVNDRLIELSEGAARQLGITNSGTAAVRVRRVNPPQGERDVLRSGGQAPARLDTPPSLLTALRKKIDGQKSGVSLASIVNAPVATPAQSPIPATKVPTLAPVTDDGFIVENIGSARASPARSSTPDAATKPAASKIYYVQIASFSSEARAKVAAGNAGGKVEKSGSLYRVRSEHFASESEANKALAKAKKAGFGDARVIAEAR